MEEQTTQTTIVAARVSTRERAKLDGLARSTHRTRSEVIRLLIAAATATRHFGLKLKGGNHNDK